MIKRLAAFSFSLFALGCGEVQQTNSQTSALVTKGERWSNPSNIPVCIVNRGEVNDEMANDIKDFVTNEYAAKTALRFTGWGACTQAQMSQKMIRLYFKRSHNWDGNGISAGGGLSWIGPVAASCGNDCKGGTMYVTVGTRGAYPTGTYRQFAIDQTRSAAVHEFGHAIGIAHEHDRADAPQCGSVKGNIQNNSSYVFVGSYDPNSIMNYCKRDNINRLSAGDVAGIAYLYGSGGGVKDPVPTPKPTPTPTPNPNPGVIPPAANATFALVNRLSGKCVDVGGWSKENFQKIISWDCGQNQANQNFKLVDAGGGAFFLQNINSGKCLDVIYSTTGNGAQIVQYQCHGTENQKVRFNLASDGYYTLNFKHSNRCLDLKAHSKASGADYLQWECHASPNQQFKLQKK